MSANGYTVQPGTPTFPIDDERHGTQNGYVNLRCRCRDCRDAYAEAQAQYRAARARRLQLDPSLAPHGSAATYSNWCCRCEPCTAAKTSYTRRREAHRRATS